MNKTDKIMKSGSYLIRFVTLFFLVAGLTATTAFAQEDQAYKESFNAALEIAKEGQQAQKADNPQQAVAKYTEAYNAFIEASKAAKQAGDDQIANKATYVAAQLAYKAGLTEAQQENYENAITHFEFGIENYPQYARNYFGRANALQKMERIDEAMTAYQEAAKVGNENSDFDTAQKAKSSIRDYFVYRASSALSAENPTKTAADEAIQYMEQLQEYAEPDADVYFYLAAAHNIKGNYDQAVAMADQALELHSGSRSDKAKIYFVKGEALMNQGNKEAARAAFQNATYGEYEASAQHYLEQLGGAR